MKREIKITADGSKTLFINELNEGYHSHHGALQEARHVFIDYGLNQVNSCEINILELGFGTGLNVLVTLDEFLKTDKNHVLRYFTLEKYPVKTEEIIGLDYGNQFNDKKMADLYQKVHQVSWEKVHEILPGFSLQKFQRDFFTMGELSLPPIDLVYFDCFGARVQPDLWEMPLLKLVADKMRLGGLFTTYASKGSLKRNLIELGFEVEKRPGPPGKREMLNAVKLS